MHRVGDRAFCLFLSAIAFSCAAVAVRGETVRTVDDKSFSGTIKGFTKGELLLQPKPADPAVVKIPLAEIVEIKLRASAAKTQTPGKAASPPRAGGSSFGSMLGAFLGLPAGPTAEPAMDSNDPADQPEAGDEVETPPDASTPVTPPTYSSPSVDTPTASAVPVVQAGGATTLVATDSIGATPASADAAAPVPDPPAPGEPNQKTAPQAVPTTAPRAIPTTGPAAMPRAVGPLWHVELAAGDRLTASLAAGAEGHVKLSLDGAGAAQLDIPLDQLRAIWSSSETLVKKARDLKTSTVGQDIAFVEKDGEVKSVAGIVAGIEKDSLKFKFEGEERRIKLDRLAGVVLAERETPPERSLYESFTLVNGDVLSGRLESIERDVLQMKPLAGGDVTHMLGIPLPLLAMVEVKNGRLTWLGDLAPAVVSQVPYFDRLMPFRVNESLTGGPLVLADGAISKGIAVHSKCVLTYDVGGAFERFRTKVGFQQPEGKAGRAPVRILGDGKVLWSEQELKGDASKPADVDLAVAGVKRLTLEADYGPNQDVAGRVVWGEARLVKAAAK